MTRPVPRPDLSGQLLVVSEMSDNKYSDEIYEFEDDDYHESGEDDDDREQECSSDSEKEDKEQDTGEDEIGEADDDRDEEKRSHSCHSYPQYPRYPAYPPCCGSTAGGGNENVEAKVSMKMSNMSLNEKVKKKEGTTQQQKQ